MVDVLNPHLSGQLIVNVTLLGKGRTTKDD